MREWLIGVEEEQAAEAGDTFYPPTPAMIRLYAAPQGSDEASLVTEGHTTLANALHDLADQIAGVEDFQP